MVQALIIPAAVFVIGALLLLERRCLGKPAVVQPLAICLLGGMLLGQKETGLWLGISLQLLSMGQSHYCNWVLTAIYASGSVAVLSSHGIYLTPGIPATTAVLLCAILLGILFDYFDRKLNLRRSAVEQRGIDIWKSEQSGDEFANLIYRKVFRGFLFGGAQSVFGVGLTALVGYLMSIVIVLQPRPEVQQIVALSVPLFGVAVTLGTLSGRLFPFFALIGVAVSAGIGGVL